MRITRNMIANAKIDNLRRLGRFLKVRGLNDMSDRQLRRFFKWLFTREEKWSRNMGGWSW